MAQNVKDGRTRLDKAKIDFGSSVLNTVSKEKAGDVKDKLDEAVVEETEQKTKRNEVKTEKTPIKVKEEKKQTKDDGVYQKRLAAREKAGRVLKTTTISKEAAEKVKNMAAILGMSETEFMEKAIEEYIVSMTDICDKIEELKNGRMH